MMETEQIIETSVCSSTLTRLIARENLSTFNSRESFKSYIALGSLRETKCVKLVTETNMSDLVEACSRHRNYKKLYQYSRTPSSAHRHNCQQQRLSCVFTELKYIVLLIISLHIYFDHFNFTIPKHKL
jgi:hypothetical protein